MDLFLLENTSISLRELDEMDPERKAYYYYMIIERLKEEKKRMDNKTKNKGRSVDTLSGSNE